MTVNCQVGAQEEELSWFYSQVATEFQAEAASEQQRASCPEKSVRHQKGFISTFPSLNLKVQEDDFILTIEGNTEEQNNASPSRQEELHLCLISSESLHKFFHMVSCLCSSFPLTAARTHLSDSHGC